MSQGATLLDADLNGAADPAGAERGRAGPDVRPPGDAAPLSKLRDDAGSFEDLVSAYERKVTRLVHRLLGWRGGSAVEDVVQDVFLAAFTHRDRFRGDASLSTWLTAITVNRCRSHQRRWRLWWRWRQDQGGSRDPAASDPPLDHRLASGETAEHVRSAVRRLPARDREVIVLRYFEGLTSPEIAALTRQSKNSVEVRLHRARAKLAETLGPWVREEQ